MTEQATARPSAQEPAGPADFGKRSRALAAAAHGRARIDGAFDLMAETLHALGYGEGVEILLAAVELDRRPSEPQPDRDTDYFDENPW